MRTRCGAAIVSDSDRARHRYRGPFGAQQREEAATVQEPASFCGRIASGVGVGSGKEDVAVGKEDTSDEGVGAAGCPRHSGGTRRCSRLSCRRHGRGLPRRIPCIG